MDTSKALRALLDCGVSTPLDTLAAREGHDWALVARFGSLAWYAYDRFRMGAQACAAEELVYGWGELQRERFVFEPGLKAQCLELLMLRSMITTMRATDRLDDACRIAWEQQIAHMDLDTSTRGMLFEELHAPMPVDELSGYAWNPEAAVIVYLITALTAPRLESKATAFLATLAHELRLPAGLVGELHRVVAGLLDEPVELDAEIV